MKIYALALVTGLLTGCGGIGVQRYEPFTMRDTSDVEALRTYYLSLDPPDMLIKSITDSIAACDTFFDSLDLARRQTNFRIGRLASLTTGLPPILQTVEASSKSIAIISAALGFGTDWIKDRKTIFLLAELKPAAHRKWQEARGMTQEKTINLALSTPNLRRSIAEHEAYSFNRLCSPSQLTSWVEDAAGSSPLEPTTPKKDQRGFHSTAGGAGRLIPPLVVKRN